MLRSLKEITGYKIHATDDKIGNVYDFYIDDNEWCIRYLVADTGNWLPGKKVLIPPVSLDAPNWREEFFPVNLTKNKIENSPSIDKHIPVSRQYEKDLYQYYGWPVYWAPTMQTTPMAPLQQKPENSEKEIELDEPNLRSTNEILGYNIQAIDGKIGHVEDFLVDDTDWIIRYMVIDTKNFLPGKKVVISPEWIEEVNWFQKIFSVSLYQELIKKAPEYDPLETLDRDYEADLFDTYGKPRYWI